jgi:GT2 family glycosyltransferase
MHRASAGDGSLSVATPCDASIATVAVAQNKQNYPRKFSLRMRSADKSRTGISSGCSGPPARHSRQAAILDSAIQQAASMALSPQIAVILSTYQRPDHLYRSLFSLDMQLGVTGQYEVVVTDDGSTDQTRDVVARFARSADFPLKFTTHKHQGFQLARCRNDGVLATNSPYLLFSDSDCIFPPNHLYQHLKVRRAGTAWSGDCLHLDEKTTKRIDERTIASRAYQQWVSESEYLRLSRRWFRDRVYQALGHPKKPKLTGSNIAVWREDFERINGFDERYIGWGCEDDDLADRLRASGVRIASILGTTQVFHMWHPRDPSQPRKWSDGANVAYLLRRDKPTRCVAGLSTHEPLVSDTRNLKLPLIESASARRAA